MFTSSFVDLIDHFSLVAKVDVPLFFLICDFLALAYRTH